MKLLALLGLVGLALAGSSTNSQLKWRPGTEYHFDYEGRHLTGLPELASHFSGLGLNCKVEVTVSHQNKLGLKITQPKYVRVNAQLNGEGTEIDANWRKIALPAFQEVPADSKRWLESPIRFEFSSNGVFQQLTVSRDEPEWSVNFKKALVSILHVRFEEDSFRGPAENRLSADSDEPYVDYWKTREESLDGTCDVTYQVNELPAYMIRELPQKAPYPEGCPRNAKFYGIVKTRDVSSCSKRAAFMFYKPGYVRCTTGNCEGMWTRSSITRYVACGTGRDDLRIQSVVNEGELNVNLMGFNAEKFLTGTRQSLRLVKEVSSSSARTPAEPSNPVAIKNLYYEYDLKSQNTDALPLVNQANLEESNLLCKNGRGYCNTNGNSKYGSAEESKIITQMRKLFAEIINEDLFNHENVGEKQLNQKVLGLARAFTVLNKTAIGSVYHELKAEFSSEEKKHMFKNVFFDTLIMGGSVSNVNFVKEQILAGELSTAQTMSIFTFLPTYVLTPTRGVLKNIYELVTSSHIREKPILYNHAVLGFTTLLQKACIADNRETAYPTFVYGDFCDPESDIVVNTWIPYLQRELNEAKTPERRNLIIVALGLMSHKNIIPVLVPYVENTHRSNAGGVGESSKLSRFLAVYSLGLVCAKYPNLVSPMVYSVFANPAEKAEVRIAAFNVIIRSEPTMTVFHKIAASTWREKDPEVLKVVNTALYSLSQQEDLVPMQVTGSSLVRKAWLVYPLIKKTGGAFPTSAAVHTADYLKHLGVGYRRVSSWFTGKDSVIPNDMYNKFTYYFGRYQFTPMEIGLRVSGGENLIEQLIDALNPDRSREESREEFSDRVSEKIHDEWRHVIDNLRIKNRDEGGEAEGALFFNFFEDSPMFVSLKSVSSEAFREKVDDLVRNPNTLRDLTKGEDKKVNFQRMFDLAPTEISIPSDMGFPILIEMHTPVTMSVRGKLSLELANRATPGLKMEFKTLFAMQMTGFVGTVCPFTDEYTFTGVEKHTVFNLPVQFDVDVNVREHRLNLKIKSLSSSSAEGYNVNGNNNGGVANLMTYQIRPFTVHQGIWNLHPMTLSPNFKVIESRSPVKAISYHFGEHFGLDLKAVVASESHFLDFRSVMKKLEMVKYNPLNLIRFAWANGGLSEKQGPSFRSHKFQVKYDPAASATKEIDFQLEYGYASKYHGDSSNRIHQLEVAERKSDRDHPYFPYKVNYRNYNEINEHVNRNVRVNDLLEGANVDYGRALTVKYTLALKGGGSHHRTFGHTINFVSGFNELKEKWDLHLESEHSGKMICVKGYQGWPKHSSSVWKMDDVKADKFEYEFENNIGFGEKCQEHKIDTKGSTRVSDRQKDYANESAAVRRYQKLVERGVPAAEFAEVAEVVRRELSRLDELDFTIEYKNVPKKVMLVPEYFVQFLKTVWWSSLTPSQSDISGYNNNHNVRSGSSGSEVSGKSEYKFRFSQSSGDFNLTIHRSYVGDIVRFEHVSLPYPLSYLLPVYTPTTGGNSVSYNFLRGSPFASYHPKCKVEDRWIKTFSNATTDLKIDDCFHLLSGDCSTRKRFAVLVRQTSTNEDSAKEIKIYLGKTDIHLKPSNRHTKQATEVKVIVNGTEMPVSRKHPVAIKDERGAYVGEVRETEDGVILLKSKYVDVMFDGEKVVVEASYKDKLCGLCGDLNGQVGPGECMYSRPEVYSASYRVPNFPNTQCSSLPRQVEDDLENETRNCAKYEEFPTRVLRAYETQSGKCTKHRHEIIDRHHQICFSRQPVTECSSRCRPSSAGVAEKKVGFACMPKNRAAEHYADKVRQGKVLRELENLSKDFSVTMTLPRHCVPV